VTDSGPLLKLPTHEITLTLDQQASVERLLALFHHDLHNTPSAKDAAGIVGDEVLAVLIARGDLISVSAEVLFLRETYEKMVAEIRAYLLERHTITVAQVRDRFATSRKYALALMEHLDAAGLTQRQGDERVLK